ncbi:MAG: PHP domain-containing protein [Methylococcaceae bacterium]
MTSEYDLHCHSNVSDGFLAPAEVVQRAANQGVKTLALTDHDTGQGIKQAQQAADQCAINLIPGIELSVSWSHHCFHIIGLNINPEYPPLVQGTNHLQTIRQERAEKIANKLQKKGIDGAFEAVKKIAGNGMITRTHFADFLVNNNYVSDQQAAFNRYLRKGKPAFVASQWTELEQAIDWIIQSGGIAIIAHPLRYNLTGSKLKKFIEAFKASGGSGIEVVTGRYNQGEINLVSQYAKKHDLLGSIGSDFHTPKQSWVELGKLAPLPSDITPVWSQF